MNVKQQLVGMLGGLMFVLVVGTVLAVFAAGYLIWRWVTSN